MDVPSVWASEEGQVGARATQTNQSWRDPRLRLQRRSGSRKRTAHRDAARHDARWAACTHEISVLCEEAGAACRRDDKQRALGVGAPAPGRALNAGGQQRQLRADGTKQLLPARGVRNRATQRRSLSFRPAVAAHGRRKGAQAHTDDPLVHPAPRRGFARRRLVPRPPRAARARRPPGTCDGSAGRPPRSCDRQRHCAPHCRPPRSCGRHPHCALARGSRLQRRHPSTSSGRNAGRG